MASCSTRKTCRCTCGIAGLLVVVFMMLSSFGAALTSRLATDGFVARCPILGATKSMCVDVTGHLQIWRDAFLATPPGRVMALAGGLIVLFVLGCALGSAKWRRMIAPTRAPPGFLCARRRTFGWIDYLQRLFATGLLHPKIF